MKYYPIFLKITEKVVLVSGAGECATAKLRLLLKTEADIHVFGKEADAAILDWALEKKLKYSARDITATDINQNDLLYCANDDPGLDLPVAELGRQKGAIVNVVDNLEESAFITPAIVDRDPVTIAIGTEGAAPVLARGIKQRIEELLPQTLGTLAQFGQSFRPDAEKITQGPRRRRFWHKFYFERGPKLSADLTQDRANAVLKGLLDEELSRSAEQGHVFFVGAGPGDPELLTLKARNVLHEADVIIHDSLVSAEILELARREAVLIKAGKRGFGPSALQEDINAEIVSHAAQGHKVVRLKGGDPTVFGRLDEELDAVQNAGIAFSVIPGITTASAAMSALNQSFTKRGRNSSFRVVTGHDMEGYAEQDWKEIARPGEVTAIYMGKKSAKFFRGRMLMHGAATKTPITIIENVSLPSQKTLLTDLMSLPDLLSEAKLDGPVLIIAGIHPRQSISENQPQKDQAWLARSLLKS